MQFKAVIFDLDGTLLDSVHDIANAANAVLRRHNFPVHDVSYYRHAIGRGASNLVLQIVPESIRNSELFPLLVNQILEEYAANLDGATVIYHGVPELLTSLNQQDIALAILSNKDHNLMPEVMAKYFKTWKFNLALGARDAHPIKPDPYGALEIAQKLKHQPQEIIFVGDSSVDMQTAINAGMYPVGVSWGFRSIEELLEHGAKLIINHPLELLDLFK